MYNVNMTKFIIIRGIPGSGKSTVAKMLASAMPALHYEADMWFYKRTGEYDFHIDQLHTAHKWCFDSVENALHSRMNVIVSNTFTTIKELKPYVELGAKHGIKPQIITCQSSFGSIHDVPDEVIAQMQKRFVHDISSLI